MTTSLEELKSRVSRLNSMGGEKRVAKHKESGKLTARERLDALFDPGTFQEIDLFVSHRCTHFGLEKAEAPADGVITGYGKIDGRLCYAFAQDATVMGGSLGEMHAKKICKAMDLALKSGSPFIGLNESGGARIQEGVDALDGYGNIFYRNTVSSGVIPQISAIMGASAGGAVYSPGLTDFILMVEGTSQMFITGPDVIKTVTGEEVTKEALGGAAAHNQKSGVAHFWTQNDLDCLQTIRRLLSFIPSNNLDEAPPGPPGDPAERREAALAGIVPEDSNKPYDVRQVIAGLADFGDFLEVQGHWAMNMVVGFIRIGGESVGVIANQPRVLAGCIDINCSDKASRFIRFCDAFNLPILTLVDTPGYLPGTAQEFGGIIRHGAKLLYAYAEATVPKITLVLRKAYGGAYLAMCAKSMGADQVLAWPTAEIAVMGAEGAANIVFKDEISQAGNPAEARKAKVGDYRQKFNNPYVAASRGYVDAVIDPVDTRPWIARALEALKNKREVRPGRKHGNFPV